MNLNMQNSFQEFASSAIEDKFAELRALIEASNSSLAVEMVSEVEKQFRYCLMENISDGVIFVDSSMSIKRWNKSVEQITGLSATTTLGSEFTPGLVGMSFDGVRADSADCPVADALANKKQVKTECVFTGRSGREINVELNILPVFDAEKSHGCVVLVMDRSVNAELRRQLSDLQNATSLDPLTRVANRAKFEEDLANYIKAHKSTNSKCSLIVCDLDFFKKVNDTYGHNVGDQALVAFAQTLKKFVRSRDVVARYGGEEFVIICANCDVEGAAKRAEEIRMSLNKTPQAMLDGKTMSASFGVSELRANDELTDLFVRADQALYTAKQNGRNRVEKYADKLTSSKNDDTSVETSTASGVQWRKLKGRILTSEEFRTSTSSAMLAEKLRGYITEVDAKILTIEPNYASISVPCVDPRNTSRKTQFRVDVELVDNDESVGKQKVTYLKVTIFKPRQKLFGKVHDDLYSHLMNDLRRYFMITDDAALIRLNPAATSSGRDEQE